MIKCYFFYFYFFQNDEALWNIVFYLTAGIFIFAGNVFIFAASAQVQPWNMAMTKDGKLSITSSKPVAIQKKRSIIYQLE